MGEKHPTQSSFYQLSSPCKRDSPSSDHSCPPGGLCYYILIYTSLNTGNQAYTPTPDKVSPQTKLTLPLLHCSVIMAADELLPSVGGWPSSAPRWEGASSHSCLHDVKTSAIRDWACSFCCWAEPERKVAHEALNRSMTAQGTTLT